MRKVCVIIGEGPSEEAFFRSLLINQFGFTEVAEKHNYMMEGSKSVFYILANPPSVSREGKSRLYSSETYRLCDDLVRNKSYLLGGGKNEVNYKLLHDADDCNEDSLIAVEKRILNAFKASNVKSSVDVHFVCNTLESWYIAGLTNKLPMLDDFESREVVNILKCNPDEIKNPKESFNEILRPELRGQAKKMGLLCGKHMNIKQARKRSSSFDGFISKLEDNELL